MLREYKVQTRLCAWSGLFFLGLAYFMGGLEDDGWLLFSRFLCLGGYVLTACGTFMYGRGKGYEPVIGLAGVLGNRPSCRGQSTQHHFTVHCISGTAEAL